MITVKRLAVRLHAEDVMDSVTLERKVKEMASIRAIDSCALSDRRELLFCSGKYISFNSGMTTLRNRLCLKHVPERITDNIKRVDDIICDSIRNTLDEEHCSFVFSFGPHFEKGYINTLMDKMNKCKGGKNRRRGREAIKRVQYGAGRCTKKQDLEGTYTMCFEERGMYATVESPRRKEVVVTGYPHVTENKANGRKHMFIYSKRGACGKTDNCIRFKDEFNAVVLNTIDHLSLVQQDVQFILFDDVTNVNCLDMVQLKNITSGLPTVMKARSRSRTYTFCSREDLQIIMMSNTSPYETFGLHPDAVGRVRMSRADMAFVENVFEIVCIDGDKNEHKKEATCINEMLEDQYMKELRNCFKDVYPERKLDKNIFETTMDIALAMKAVFKRAKHVHSYRYNTMKCPRQVATHGVSCPSHMESTKNEIYNELSVFVKELKKALGTSTVPCMKIPIHKFVSTVFNQTTNTLKTGNRLKKAMEEICSSDDSTPSHDPQLLCRASPPLPLIPPHPPAHPQLSTLDRRHTVIMWKQQEEKKGPSRCEAIQTSHTFPGNVLEEVSPLDDSAISPQSSLSSISQCEVVVGKEKERKVQVVDNVPKSGLSFHVHRERTEVKGTCENNKQMQLPIKKRKMNYFLNGDKPACPVEVKKRRTTAPEIDVNAEYNNETNIQNELVIDIGGDDVNDIVDSDCSSVSSVAGEYCIL